MDLAISNIGWASDDDTTVYHLMKKYGYTGLEIAPTRIFPNEPYEMLSEAVKWCKTMNAKFGFTIPSMQSIWFGRNEKLYGSSAERQILLEYTKKAIDFAAAINCKNLVFGCPRNRVMPEQADERDAVRFFKEIGDYAISKGTVIGIEANPPIYNTNYINDTKAALNLIKRVDSKGFLLNLDVGTMIENNESVSTLKDNILLINHVHISEPGLKPILARELHQELKKVFLAEHYKGYVSIEMGKFDNLDLLEQNIKYVKEVFQ